MPKIELLQHLGKPDFEEFLESKGIAPNDPIVPLVRETWDQAIDTAAAYFDYHEGTDYRVGKYLKSDVRQVVEDEDRRQTEKTA